MIPGLPPVRIKANFKPEDIKKQVEEMQRRFETAVISRLNFIGLNFVKRAREGGNYTDRTGNLRSSIGFLVLKDGAIVSRNFELAKKGTDKKTGYDESVRLAEEIADKYPSGYVLIVVAGMEYAAAVESGNRKGYQATPKDVLTKFSQGLEDELKKAIADITKQL